MVMTTRRGQTQANSFGNLLAPFISSVLILLVQFGVPLSAEQQNAIISAIVCGWTVIAGAKSTYYANKANRTKDVNPPK